VRSAELQLERAQIHADRAHRQFDACEPENRQVARTLEREWEQRLTEVRAAERAVAQVATKRPEPLTREEIAWCRHAGADLRKVFDAPSTPDRERKQLLRAILTDVVVTVDRTAEQHSAQLRVVREGGQITEHTVALPRTGSHTRCTDQDTIALVRQLAERYPDQQIAAILSRQGRRTGAGNQFTAHNVHGLRSYHKIPACPVRTDSDDGEIVTIAKAAAKLDVSTATVHRWLREGFITGEQITPGAPWQIRLTDELRQRVCAQPPDRWLPLTEAAEALGVVRVAQGPTPRAGRRLRPPRQAKRPTNPGQTDPGWTVREQNPRGDAVLTQRHLFHVSRVDEHQLEAVLEHRPDRPPVHAGGFHRDLRDAERLKPITQRQQPTNRRLELRHVLLELAPFPDAHARGHARLVYVQRAWTLNDPFHHKLPSVRTDRSPPAGAPQLRAML
jgi:hypothetical protein